MGGMTSFQLVRSFPKVPQWSPLCHGRDDRGVQTDKLVRNKGRNGARSVWAG